jgi:hypothetical protein
VTPRFLDARLDAPVQAARTRLSHVEKPSELRQHRGESAQPYIPLITRKSAASAAP